jgi:hypothetical protein
MGVQKHTGTTGSLAVLHQPLADKGKGWALALTFRQAVRGDRVELTILTIDQRGDQMTATSDRDDRGATVGLIGGSWRLPYVNFSGLTLAG